MQLDVSMDLRQLTRTEPAWFTRWQRSVAKWFVKTVFNFLRFVTILLVIVTLIMFLLWGISWEKIIRFIVESGTEVGNNFLAIFYNSTGGG